MTRRLISTLSALLLAALLCPAVALANSLEPAGAGGCQILRASSAEPATRVLGRVANGSISYIRYLDKGRTRAVAITSFGEDAGGYYDEGQVWFVADGEAQLLLEGANLPSAEAYTKLYSVKGGKLFVVENALYMTSGLSAAWFVHGAEAVRLPEVGGHLTMTKKNEFVAYHSTYDAYHTWKNYFFRWDGKRLVEYGGKKITLAQLKRAKNGSEAARAIGKLGRITTIYYRANGIINVNYKSGSGRSAICGNVTLIYAAGKVAYAKMNSYGKTALDRAKDGGVYKKRNPDNAGTVPVNYPKSIPARLKRK